MLKKLLFALLGIVVFAIAGALVVPSFIDWNQYKGELSAQARAATGRDLTIDGDLSLSVLPSPTLSAEGVTLANLSGGSQPEMVRLGALRVRIALSPLLQGRVQVEEVILERPTVLLEILADGRRNWDLLPSGGDGAAAPANSATAAGDGVQVRLERLVVRDGTVRFRDAVSDAEETVSGLDAEISADSLQGPFEGHGTLVARDMPLGFTLNLGELGADAAPVSLAVTLAKGKAKLQLSGTMALGDAPRVTGRLMGESRNLAAALIAAGVPAASLPAALSDPLALETEIEASPAGVQANNATLQIAGSQASGAFALLPGTPPRIDATLNMARIDLDALLPRLTAPPATLARAGAVSGSAAPADAVPRPATLPAGIAAQLDLNVGTVQWRGGQVRQARLNVALDGGELSINQASALLPGGSDVALFGFVTAKDGLLRLDGQIEMVSENLRAVLAWLGMAPDGVPAERLRNLALTAKLGGTSESLSISDIDLRVDSSRLTGGVTVAMRERPAFGIGVKLDAINLDSYRVSSANAVRSGTAAQDAAPSAAGQLRGGGGLATLNDFDANVRAEIGALTVNGTTVSGLSVDGTLFGGELSLRRARIQDVGGATASITGAIAGFGGVPKLTDTTLQVRARDIRSLARLGGIEGSLPAGLAGKLALDLAATGTLSDLKLDLTGELAALRVALKGQVAALALQPRFGLAVQASHPDLVVLLKSLGIAYSPALTNSRQMAFTGNLRGDLSGLSMDAIDLAAGPIRARGTAGMTFGAKRPRLTADLTTNEIILDLLLPAKASAGGAARGGGAGGGGSSRWSNAPIDFTPLTAIDAAVLLKAVAVNYDIYRVDQPKLDLTLDNGVLQVRHLDGTMFGGTFAMTGRVSDGAVQGTLTVKDGGIRQALIDTANIDLADGRLDFETSLAARGRSQSALVNALSGNGRIEVRDGVVRGFDLDQVSAQLGQIDSAVALLGLLQSGMGGGETRFTRLNGTFQLAKGVARTEDLTIQAESGVGAAVGAVNLPGWSLDMKSDFRLTRHPDAPPFGMRLVGPLDNPRKLFQIEALQAYLLQRSAGRLIERLAPKAAPFLGGGATGQPTAPTTGGAPPPRNAPPSTTAPSKPTPEDFLKGILGNIGR